MRALERIPDEPVWVDVRGALLAGGRVLEDAGGFVVLAPGGDLLGVRGSPGETTLRQALERAGPNAELLACGPDEAAAAHRALGFEPLRAIIHTAEELVVPPPRPVRVFRDEPTPTLDDAPRELRQELAGAFAAGPVATALAGGRPVSFCYPGWITERWWDVAIDTLEPFRRRGYGAAAFFAMAQEMAPTGRRPAWGALESNTASRALAAKLGFRKAGELWLWKLRALRADD